MRKLLQVSYFGDDPTIRKGTTAIMRADGKVQLDGSKDFWRISGFSDPRCFGWYDLGSDWETLGDTQ